MPPPSIFPVAGKNSYSNDWGAARQNTGSHKGNDIFAERGTPLVAMQDGVISKIGWNRIGGWRLWIGDNENHGRWYYAHLDSYVKGLKKGDRVKAGDIVGYVGDTGDAKGTPPHLHLGYDPDGTFGANWQNPFETLQALRKGNNVPTFSDDEEPSPVVSRQPQQQEPSQPVVPQMPQGIIPPARAPIQANVVVPGQPDIGYTQPQQVASTWRLIAEQDDFVSPDTLEALSMAEVTGGSGF